jgi:TusA-related sulfurtransferase
MAKRRLRTLGAGDTLVVVATDPDAPVDFGAWAAVEGHGLSRRDRGDRIELTVVKG